jgi:energy-coupling factor transporter transmembrane protein EcfT
MAELNIFHYLPKNPQGAPALIHDMDGRIKLICMILFAIATSLAANLLDFTILTVVIAVAFGGAGLPVNKLVTEIKYFLFFIGVVIVFHSWSVPGTPISNFPIHGISWEGLSSGLFFGWRLVIIIGICNLLTGTTTLSALKNVIEWFLRPVPFIREARVAAMFSLTFVLIPLIFDQAAGMSEAQKARGIGNRKNPMLRISFLAFPLLLQTFRRADEMVLAMESRCYSEERTPVCFKTNLKDWLLLIFSGLVCALIFFRVC